MENIQIPLDIWSKWIKKHRADCSNNNFGSIYEKKRSCKL